MSFITCKITPGQIQMSRCFFMPKYARKVASGKFSVYYQGFEDGLFYIKNTNITYLLQK